MTNELLEKIAELEKKNKVSKGEFLFLENLISRMNEIINELGSYNFYNKRKDKNINEFLADSVKKEQEIMMSIIRHSEEIKISDFSDEENEEKTKSFEELKEKVFNSLHGLFSRMMAANFSSINSWEATVKMYDAGKEREKILEEKVENFETENEELKEKLATANKEIEELKKRIVELEQNAQIEQLTK